MMGGRAIWSTRGANISPMTQEDGFIAPIRGMNHVYIELGTLGDFGPIAIPEDVDVDAEVAVVLYLVDDDDE